MKDIWHALIRYESRDFVHTSYRGRHLRVPSAGRIRDITANFIQAREYFLNASRSSVTVKPLLQYYGVLALSRGLILVVSSKKDAAALKPSHGLTPHNWAGDLNRGLNEFGDITASLTKGTFWELLDATCNRSLLKANSSGVNYSSGLPIPPLGATVSFADIASRIIDVASDYALWRTPSITSDEVDSVTVKLEELRYEVAFHSGDNEARLKRIFGSPEPPIECTKDHKGLVKRASISVANIPYFSQRSETMVSLGIGGIHLVPAIRGDIYFSMLAMYFLISYFLGMTVRYFPSTWIALGRQEKGDAIFPLLNHLISLIQDKYPEMILEYLDYRKPFDNA